MAAPSGSAAVRAADTGRLKLILSGPPASGKGSQAEFLRERFDVVHLSTGDMLRAAAADPESEVGAQAKRCMEAGELVPDDVMIRIVTERLAAEDCCEKGWLLDGFPRTAAQADALLQAGCGPDAFIQLEVPDDALVDRVVGRRLDPETGKIYHLTFNPPENEEIAARLTQRADDTEEKVRVRIAAYHENISPIIEKFRAVAFFTDGQRPPADIFTDIEEHLARLSVPEVIFVLGGPGAGKGTQCENLVRNYGYTHLSAGDLLRAERNSGSELADMINDCIKEGRIVPAEVTIGLLRKAMEDSGNRLFLIDGFPRNKDNLEQWFNIVGDTARVTHVLCFECAEEIMEQRLLRRGETSGRVDDNLETIRKRFNTFQRESMPVIARFELLGLVRRVDGAQPQEDVFQAVRQIMVDAQTAPPPTRTLALIKPDAVAAGNADAIRAKIEESGFRIVQSRQTTMTTEMAREFYAEHEGKHFYENLVSFMTSGDMQALILEGKNAIPRWRSLMGPTNTDVAKQEAPESIRALFGTDGTNNATHGSDSLGSALREAWIVFNDQEAEGEGTGGESKS